MDVFLSLAGAFATIIKEFSLKSAQKPLNKNDNDEEA